MERKSLACLVIVLFTVVSISGCGSVPKKMEDEVSGIKMRVDTLESRVDGVESRQIEGGVSQASDMPGVPTEGSNIETKPRAGKSNERVMDIQMALKNAGFYSGKIDGIKGKNTRKAIREFQRSNALRADGIVGPKTWDLLSKYMSGGSPLAAGAAQEGATK